MLANILRTALLLSALLSGEAKPSGDMNPFQAMQGTYTGLFSGSELQLSLDSVSATAAAGHSLHRGQQSRMAGTVQPSAKGFRFELKELGSSPYEGIFRFELDTAAQQLSGTWTPISNRQLSVISYTLTKRTR